MKLEKRCFVSSSDHHYLIKKLIWIACLMVFFWIGSKIIFLVQSLCLSHSHYQIDINVTITHSMELIHLWFMIITNQYQIIKKKKKKFLFFTKLKWKQNWAISKTERERQKLKSKIDYFLQNVLDSPPKQSTVKYMMMFKHDYTNYLLNKEKSFLSGIKIQQKFLQWQKTKKNYKR